MHENPAHPTIRRLIWAVIAVKIAYVVAVGQTGGHLTSLDPDTWLHLTRLRELWLHGGWYDTAVPRDNTPFGVTTHWSRALDALALPIVWGGQWFMPLRDSLLLLPLWWNTLVLLCGLLPLMLATVRMAGGNAYAQGFVLASVAAGVFYFTLYSPRQFDYHTLLATVYVAMLALACPLARDRSRTSLAVAMGAVAGFGVWVSVEFLFPCLLVMLWLAFLWLRDGRLGPLWAMSAALLATALAAFVLEQPVEAWGRVEHDSLSIVHIAAMAVNVVALGLLRLCERRLSSLRLRIAAAAVAGMAMFALLAGLFPGFWLGALSTIAPGLSGTYIWRIGELRPLHAIFSPLLLMAAYIGVLGLPRLIRRGGDFDRLLALAFGTMLAAMALQTRWLGYAVPLTTLVLALWVGQCVAARRWEGVKGRWTVLLLALAPFLFAVADNLLPRERENVLYEPDCLTALEEAVREDAVSHYVDAKPQRVILPENLGTMMLFFTPHSIVASNYHRNTDGILDLDRFFKSGSDKEARAIVEQRGVDVVLLCTPQPAAQEYYPYLHALTQGGMAAPDWLRPVSQPWAGQGVRMFRVVRP